MPVGSSLTDQIGLATTVGDWPTYTVPDRFLQPVEKPDFEPGIEFMEDLPYGQAFMPEGAVRSYEFGGSGDIVVDLRTRGNGILFLHLLGEVATTGAADPYTHVFTPAVGTGLSATIQQGRTEVDATIDPFNFLGCVCTGGEITIATDATPRMSTTWDVGSHETTSALATATYASGAELYTALDGAVEIDGGGACVRSITITVAKEMATDRRCIGPAAKKQQIENGEWSLTGSMELEFDSTAAYEKFRAGTVASLNVVLTRGTHSLTFDIPVLQYRSNAFGGDIGDVNVESFDWKALKGAGDLITVTYVTADATP